MNEKTELTPFAIAWRSAWSARLTDAEKRELCTDLLQMQRDAESKGGREQVAHSLGDGIPDYLKPERMFP